MRIAPHIEVEDNGQISYCGENLGHIAGVLQSASTGLNAVAKEVEGCWRGWLKDREYSEPPTPGGACAAGARHSSPVLSDRRPINASARSLRPQLTDDERAQAIRIVSQSASILADDPETARELMADLLDDANAA